MGLSWMRGIRSLMGKVECMFYLGNVGQASGDVDSLLGKRRGGV